MQEEIEVTKPKLREQEEHTEKLMIELKHRADTQVEPQKRLIQQEEEAANAVAMEAEEIKIDCENNLQKALPILKQANDALNTIKPAHINEIRVLNYPPPTVKTVLHAICVMCDRKVEKTPKKDNPKSLEENWWYTAQKFMNEKDFLS